MADVYISILFGFRQCHELTNQIYLRISNFSAYELFSAGCFISLHIIAGKKCGAPEAKCRSPPSDPNPVFLRFGLEANVGKKKFYVPVYNTATGKIIDVEVTEEIYNTYRRSGWQIENNDSRFYLHEIQFSGLIGGEDGNFENFHEFLSDDDTEAVISRDMLIADLIRILSALPDEDKDLIRALYFEGKTLRGYAEEIGALHIRVFRRKERILAMLKNALTG